MAEGKKFVVMVTHGPDNPEMATIPFVMAAAAASADIEVVVGFQGPAVELVKRGVAETVSAPEFKPLAELINTVREFGGTYLVCGPCIKSRGIAEADLIDGAKVVTAGRFVAEIAGATNALVY